MVNITAIKRDQSYWNYWHNLVEKKLLDLRNLNLQHEGKQISIYINIDRTKLEVEHFKNWDLNWKEKQEEAVSRVWT